MTHNDLRKQFDTMIDETHTATCVMGLYFYPSAILYHLDYQMYNSALMEYAQFHEIQVGVDYNGL